MSVITPVYNGAAFIGDCIESVRSQTYANWVYDIVDNRSTDGTRDIVDGFCRNDSRIRLHVNERFLPIIDNHNVAFSRMARDSRYCKPLMADDWLVPDCLERMLEAAERDPAIGLVCCCAFDGRHVLWDGFPFTGAVGDLVSVGRGFEVARASLMRGPYVFGTPSSCLFRSDLVEARQPFYDPRNLHADHASCYDVLTGSNFAFVHRVLVFNRVHSESESARVEASDSMALGTLSALVRFGPHFLSSEEYRRRLAERLSRYYLVLGRSFLRMRPRAYWSLHARRMAEIGLPIRWVRVIAASAVVGFGKMIPPIVGMLARGIRMRLGGATRS